jgi:NAD(P)-dependent dehydrogenase (short-subunit alcohol dehydrogenase family)
MCLSQHRVKNGILMQEFTLLDEMSIRRQIAAQRMLALALREQLGADGVVVTTSHPGFIDTDMASDVPYPKASPQEVVERSLDAWEADATVVFPDRLAELVERALGERSSEVLSRPQRVMTGLVAELQGGSPQTR